MGDQAAGKAFRIVEQDFQEVFGGELLMPLAERIGLGGLHETAGAVGVILKIHHITPLLRFSARSANKRP